MKIRQGFVSNSSSSSFVVLLPENFSLDKVDFDNYKELMEDYDTTKEQVKKAFEILIRDKCLLIQETEGSGILEEILDPYTLASVSAGPDAGQMVLADREQVKKLL